MSTERWGYGRVVTAAVVVLALVALILAVWGSRQAPRVGAAQIDTAYAVQNSGSQLVLAANQPVRMGRPLTVHTTPETHPKVQARAGTVVVTFARPLHYDTEYAVVVGPVTG